MNSFLKYILQKTFIITLILLFTNIITSLLINNFTFYYEDLFLILKLSIPINLIISSIQFFYKETLVKDILSPFISNLLYILIIGVLGFGVNITIAMLFWTNKPLIYSSAIYLIGGLIFGSLLLFSQKSSKKI